MCHAYGQAETIQAAVALVGNHIPTNTIPEDNRCLDGHDRNTPMMAQEIAVVWRLTRGDANRLPGLKTERNETDE